VAGRPPRIRGRGGKLQHQPDRRVARGRRVRQLAARTHPRLGHPARAASASR
jgi:hypothetical protein